MRVLLSEAVPGIGTKDRRLRVSTRLESEYHVSTRALGRKERGDIPDLTIDGRSKAGEQVVRRGGLDHMHSTRLKGDLKSSQTIGTGVGRLMGMTEGMADDSRRCLEDERLEAKRVRARDAGTRL